MRRTFKYKIIPIGDTEESALHWLDLCRNLYNCALECRISNWRDGRRVSWFDQKKELPGIKKSFPEYSKPYAQVLCDVLKRLDKSYQSFFRRMKIKNHRAGFPRFKNKNSFRSFTYPQGGFKIKGNHLLCSKLGEFKIRLHRPIEGRIKTCTIIHRSTGEWFVCFSCDGIEQRPLPKTGRKVGIDLGLSHFAVDSDGKVTDAPKFLKAQEKYLQRCQRSMSRKQKDSKNREKARRKLAKAHDKVANQRRDFIYKFVNYYVQNYDRICVEDLSVERMMRHKYVSKSFSDAALGMTLQILTCKAESADRIFERKDPARTTTTCSACGYEQEMLVRRRIFRCEKCGEKKCRDFNSAINIRDFPAGAEPIRDNVAAVRARCVEVQVF